MQSQIFLKPYSSNAVTIGNEKSLVSLAKLSLLPMIAGLEKLDLKTFGFVLPLRHF